MRTSECLEVLTAAAALDPRVEISQARAMAWNTALRPYVTRSDALVAVAEHYASSHFELMPVHLNERVRQMRQARRRSAGAMPEAPGGDIDFGAYATTWEALAMEGRPRIECYVRACHAAGAAPERLDRHGYTPREIEAAHHHLTGQPLPAVVTIGGGPA